MLAEIGRITAIWAHIEQALIVHTSAMAAVHTGGDPREYLRMEFRRLREKWYGLCREHFDQPTFDKIVHPINSELARLAPHRGYAIHGVWSVIKRGRYLLSYFEQKTGLELHEHEYTLRSLRGFAIRSFLLEERLRALVDSNHGGKYALGSLVEIT